MLPSVTLPLFRDGQARCDGYVPRLGKGPLWTTGHLDEASMTLLSSRRKEAAGVAEWGLSE
jgi:hypothetical protein